MAGVGVSESGCLGMQTKVGDKLHLKLNMGTRPIANKYRKGKVKSALKSALFLVCLATTHIYSSSTCKSK